MVKTTISSPGFFQVGAVYCVGDFLFCCLKTSDCKLVLLPTTDSRISSTLLLVSWGCQEWRVACMDLKDSSLKVTNSKKYAEILGKIAKDEGVNAAVWDP